MSKRVRKTVMELIPEIRKYFAFNNLKAVGEPTKRKRPWLSIIKQLTKNSYELLSEDCRISNNGKEIRTHQDNYIIILYNGFIK